MYSADPDISIRLFNVETSPSAAPRESPLLERKKKNLPESVLSVFVLPSATRNVNVSLERSDLHLPSRLYENLFISNVNIEKLLHRPQITIPSMYRSVYTF